MRKILVKYEGSCSECGAILSVGTEAEYEKTTGIFCVGHFPTDPEKIREFRLGKAQKKAARYNEWAEKREQRAEKTFEHNRTYTSDLAFNTQPGHIPFRARLIAQNDRACESLEKARSMREKAHSMCDIRVKGDAERRDISKRQEVDTWVKVGMLVDTSHFGACEVLKVNKKTLTIKGKFSNFTHDKIFMSQV